jgi:hypothetical protein
MKKEKSKKSRSRKPATSAGKKRGPESPIAKFADLLGVLPDHEVAARAGVTAAGVLKYRHRHGIKAAPRRGLAERAAAAAPAAQGASVAAPTPVRGGKRGRSPGRVSKLDAYRDVIGVESDREVAQRAGLTTNAVQMYRKKHGIAASGKRGGAPRSRAAPTALVASAPAPSGGKRRGRPPGGPEGASGRPEAAAAAIATSSDRSGSWYGWRLKVAARGGELDRIVVARDAVAACAAGATAGEVVSIERIGEGIPT